MKFQRCMGAQRLSTPVHAWNKKTQRPNRNSELINVEGQRICTPTDVIVHPLLTI